MDCCQLYAESSWCLYKPLRHLLVGALYSPVGPAPNTIWSWPTPPMCAGQGSPGTPLPVSPSVSYVALETTERTNGWASLVIRGFLCLSPFILFSNY